MGLFGKRTATLVEDKYNPTKNEEAKKVWGEKKEVTPISSDRPKSLADIKAENAAEMAKIFQEGKDKWGNTMGW